MPSRQAFRRDIGEAFRSEPAHWTPQCLEPETLLDWIEQDETHPQSATLLEHMSACAYCRQEYAAMRETWALARHPMLQSTVSSATNAVRGVPRKVAAWIEQLLQEGLTTPVHAAQKVLMRMDHALASASPVAVRNAQSVSNLRPAFTAIRSSHLRLTWSPTDRAEEYLVTIYEGVERKGTSAGLEPECRKGDGIQRSRAGRVETRKRLYLAGHRSEGKPGAPVHARRVRDFNGTDTRQYGSARTNYC